jgi:peptide/nickel transport system substrate-binding protein
MGKSREGNRNSSIIIGAILIFLAISGVLSYFLVYEPYFESERERLHTFTTDLEPTTLDPALSAETDSHSIIMNVFDRLVQYKTGSTDIEPSLATSWETPDARTYIFNLRNGVMFHDSTPFNASAVKYSIERVLEIDGFSAYIFYVVESVIVLDTYRVQINLFEDFAPFIQVMAHPVASIVSPTAAEQYGEDFENNPVGTGPYKFESWDSNELVLTANQEYFKGAPNFEKLVFKVILEASDREQELLAGRIDAVFTAPPGVPVEDLDDLEQNPDVQVIKGITADVEFLGMNALVPPLDNLKVRQAIAYALDYDAIIQEVMQGRAARIGGPVPPGIFGYKNITATQRDVAKAQQLLNEAGYSDGFEITISYNIDNLARRKTAEIVRDSLADVGIQVSILGLDFDSLIDSYFAMEYEMTINKWIPDYFDADSYLFPQFHTISQTEGFNIFGFSDPEVDDLIDQARSTLNENTRLQAYQEAQDKIVEQVPVIFLYVPEIYDVVRFNVYGWEHSPTGFVYAYPLYRR